MAGTPPPTRLLLWDAPNIDVALGTLLGGRAPRPEERPRFDVLARWLVKRTGPDEEPEACVFANVTPDGADRMRGWVEVLRSSGYAVFLKPKAGDEDDIDADLLAHVHLREAERPLAEVILASADRFRDLGADLGELARRLPLTVIGFREFNSGALRDGEITFIDLEDIPGLFQQPLDREVPIDMLPPEGAWLAPRKSLRELYG